MDDQLARLQEGIRRADAAGDVEGVRALGAEYRRLSAAPQATAPVQQAAPPVEPSLPPKATGENTWRENLMAGPVGQFMGGAMQPIYGADQLVYKGLGAATSLGGLAPNSVSDFMEGRANAVGKEAELSRQTYAHARERNGLPGGSVPEVVGEIASPANFAVGGLSTGSKLGSMLLQNAALGATTPVNEGDNYWANKGAQTGLGAVLGGVVHGGGKVLNALVDPVKAYGQKVATLLNEGVPLTGGQIMGGTVKRMEDAATSIPFVGDMIKSRQRDAVEWFNRAAINRSLAPIGEKLPDGVVGHEAIQIADSKLSNAYNTLLSGMSGSQDAQLVADINNIIARSAPDYGVTGAAQTKLKDLLKGQVVEKADNGFYSGDVLKDVQSNLSHQARTHSKSQNPDDKNLSDALFDAKKAFDDFIMRQNPKQAPELQKINEGWANFARPQAAAERAMKDGVFTPSQLGMSVRAGGTRGQNARGEAKMQDLSSAAQEILPSTVPDSGTPLRHAVQGGLALTGLGLGGEHLVPGAAGTATGAAALGAILAAGGTRGGQAAIRTILTKRPYSQNTAAALGNLLTQTMPVVARVGVPATVSQLSNGGPK